MSRVEQIAREDVLLFINAATASTAQREFASTASEQILSLDFLHDYVFGNYRDLYAAALVRRLDNAGFGYLLKPDILAIALRNK